MFEKLHLPAVFFDFFSFSVYCSIIVPDPPSIAVADVMTTLLTPACIASKEFSSLGIIPPCMIPSLMYCLNSASLMWGIRLSSFSESLSTPFFSFFYIKVTLKVSAMALAVSPAMVSALVFRSCPFPSCVRGDITGTIPL